MLIQWNLSIADILYSGHLSIADIFSRNQLSRSTVKLLYLKPLDSGHVSIADTFFENQWCLLFRGSTFQPLKLFCFEDLNESKLEFNFLKGAVYKVTDKYSIKMTIRQTIPCSINIYIHLFYFYINVSTFYINRDLFLNLGLVAIRW